MIIYVMCGIPSSGKTTLATKIVEKQKGILLSFDEIKYKHKLRYYKDVCDVMYQNIVLNLEKGNNVVCDAPHIKRSQREDLLNAISNIPCKKILVVMTTPLEECLYRNKNRNIVLCDETIKKMYNEFQSPTLDEGWDEIIYY